MNIKDIAALAEIVKQNELTKLEINGENNDGPLGMPASIAISPSVQSSSSLPKKKAAAF